MSKETNHIHKMYENQEPILRTLRFSYNEDSNSIAGQIHPVDINRTGKITDDNKWLAFLKMIFIGHGFRSSIQLDSVSQTRVHPCVQHFYAKNDCIRSRQYSDEQRKKHSSLEEANIPKLIGLFIRVTTLVHLTIRITAGMDMRNATLLRLIPPMMTLFQKSIQSGFVISPDETMSPHETIAQVYSDPSLLNLLRSIGNLYQCINQDRTSNIPFPASLNSQSLGSSLLPIQQPQEPQDVEIPISSVSSNTIHILLLGETGVGKSTFINAFANYLTFDTLEQAQTGRPIVLIPVSFLITTGDNFDEHIVKFSDGVDDDADNEDFAHDGQSVTQHCRSYQFNLKDNTEKKLRIIDTPGFGDTRGVNQDENNIAHIIDYVRNLSHLNAICFLLKPNESRLNIFFRSCLTQLLSLFGANIADNILFCFTNARATFYTPGNTGPILKKMLTSLPDVNVQLRKDNCFCFDSESFRYLVALENGIAFTDCDRDEYEKSWTKSVAEAERFVHYINIDLHPKMVGLTSMIT